MSAIGDLRGRVREALAHGYVRLEGLSYRGRWRSFPTPAGSSTTWVTGFVLAHLAACGTYEGDTSSAVRAILAEQRSCGGWGFAKHVPPDADSTAWCLMGLDAAGADVAAARRAAESFLSAQVGPGGVRTYHPQSGIDGVVRVADSGSVAGWTTPQTDVSLAVMLCGVPSPDSRDAAGLVCVLLRHQEASGWFPSYWWRTGSYASALLLRLLERRSEQLAPDKAGRLLLALERSRLAEGGYALDDGNRPDAFSTALALETACRLGLSGGNRLLRGAVDALLAAQEAHGGWQGARILRIPSPQRLTTATSAPLRALHAEDTGGVFATAVSCYALDLWLRRDELEKEGVHGT